jgi:hypothetical protein
MQLDRTRIAIRERGVLDVFDLSLHVLREFFGPLIVAWAVVAVPLMVLNYLLIGWMANADFLYEFPLRYCWHYAMLVFIEAPLFSIPIVGFLGPAVFGDRPTLRTILSTAWRYTPHWSWCLLVLRGIGPAWIYCLLLERGADGEAGLEGFVIFLFFAYGALVHAVRPFTAEIILLERPPFFSSDPKTRSLHSRSADLHGAAQQLAISNWLVAVFVGLALFAGLLTTTHVLMGVLFATWQPTPWLLQWAWPVPAFLAVGYLTVVRFMCYLDARIRNEGWEVELLLRAEAARLQHKIGT